MHLHRSSHWQRELPHSRILTRRKGIAHRYKSLLASASPNRDLSCADLAGNLIGSLRSRRRDLATNKKLLEEAMLADARRGRQRIR
jgi:hypothetical protein